MTASQKQCCSPTTGFTLKPYQKVGVDFLAEKERAILGDEMGLGKTIQALAATDKIGAENILVVCPSAVRTVWANEYAEQQSIRRKIKVINGSRDSFSPNGVNIVSVDTYWRMRNKSYRPDVLILDEAHFLKTKTSKRTKAIFSDKGIVKDVERVWALSGTPMPNNPSELWPMLRYMFGCPWNYWQFVRRFCEGYEDMYGFKITGIRNEDHLRRIMRRIMLRRLAEDVLDELPPISYYTLPLNPQKLNAELIATINGPEGQDVRDVLEKNPDMLKSLEGRVSTLRRLTGLAKAAPCAEWVSTQLDSGMNKIILFAHHKGVIKILKDTLLPYGCATVVGGQTRSARDAEVKRFNHDPRTRVFIGQITAAGTGLTLNAANNVLFVESSWVPAENAQAAKRCHRIGQSKPVFVRFASLTGSLDEAITRVVASKTRMITKTIG